MQDFMVMLLTCSVTMSALALFYIVITPLLAKRYSEKGRYYAWLIIVIGLIIPFRPQFNNAIVKLDMPREMAAPVIRIGNGTPVAAAGVNTALPLAFPGISLWQIAAVIWLAGMVVFFAYHIIKHCHFVKMTARWSERITDIQILALLQSLKSEIGISRPISLYQCLSIGSPMMIGFVKPLILLPTADLAHDEFRFILKHELVHYKRKDLYYKCLVLLATAIHWFNPIVYLMAQAVDHQCELSCDAETMRSADADTRQHYSETIIGVAKFQSKLKTALSTDFYGGKKGMKKRISSIMDTNKKRMGIAILCGALILTLGTAVAFSANTGATRTEADTGNYSAGDIVAIQITAESVSDLIAYEFRLNYDENAMKVKGTRSSIDGIPQVFYAPDDGYTWATAAMSREDYSFNGENVPICEFVMEILRDGPVEGLSIQNFYAINTEHVNSPTKSVDITSGCDFKIVLNSLEDSEIGLFTMPETEPELQMTYYEQSIDLKPGELVGDYSGQLHLQVEKQDVSPGESFQVEVFLSESAESALGEVYFWFDPDELTYQGFDGDEELEPYHQTVDSDAGIVRVGFKSLEENENHIERFGSFRFKVSENPQLSGRQSSLIIAADYVAKDDDKKLLLSQSGEISLSIR